MHAHAIINALALSATLTHAAAIPAPLDASAPLLQRRNGCYQSALLPGYRPANIAADAPFVFTAIIEIEPQGSGTKYTAIALHSTEDGRSKHESLGFHSGWGAALDQLVALVKSW